MASSRSSQVSSCQLLKFTLVGDTSVGKTALLYRYADDQFSATYCKNTIGCDFRVKEEEVDGKRVKLQVWDTVGQERYASLSRAYYRGAQCVIICYDTTCRASFNNVKHWHNEAMSHWHSANNLEVQNTPSEHLVVMLVGTKIDLVENRKVTEEVGRRMATEIGAKIFMETSAKTGEGIDQGFHAAASASFTVPAAAKRAGGVKLPDPSQQGISSRDVSSSTNQSGPGVLCWC